MRLEHPFITDLDQVFRKVQLEFGDAVARVPIRAAIHTTEIEPLRSCLRSCPGDQVPDWSIR